MHVTSVTVATMLGFACGALSVLGIVLLWRTPQAAHKNYFFKDSSFEFQFLRTLGRAPYQMADIGECLQAARTISEGNFESWYASWYALAERVYTDAESSYAQEHYQSALTAYLRASNYYRAAEFYLHGNPQDTRILEAYKKSRDCFLNVTKLSNPKIEVVKIPYEKTFLPGYFYRAPGVTGSQDKRPLVIIQTGFDGTQEELYPYAQEALKRGFNALTFEGPGQGGVLREQHLPFRADWEQVITPVLDYALTRPEVDATRVALYGLSLGGYLAPRGASKDHRVKALIANSGIYDLSEVIIKNFPGINSREQFVQFVNAHPDACNAALRAAMKKNIQLRWTIEHGMYAFAAPTPRDFLLKYQEFSLQGLINTIVCPTLVCVSEYETPGLEDQAKRFYDFLTCPKEYIFFTTAEGTGEHCQITGVLRANQRVFDWLDALWEPTAH